jgi:hypothetical protein
MTAITLREHFVATGEAFRATGHDVADASFVDEEAVSLWLISAAEAAGRRDFLLAAEEDPSTLYVWMDEPSSNTDTLSLRAFGMGPARSATDRFDWRDALIGDEIGDLRVPPLRLTGMADALALLARQDLTDADRSTLEDLVVVAAFDLVARGLTRAPHIPLRIAMSRSEEWRVCTWETAADAPQVHVWTPAQP